MSFAHLPVQSMADATRNLEQMRSSGTVGLELPVEDMGDLATNFEQIEKLQGISLPHVPPRDLKDVTRNFEVLDG